MRRLAAAAGGLLVSGLMTARLGGGGTDAGAYEVLANAFGFSVDIPGCADASQSIREIAIDDLTIDAREMTTGLDVEYRLYGPGVAHWGKASFKSACTPGCNELGKWYKDVAKGKDIRKNITPRPSRSRPAMQPRPTRWRPLASGRSRSSLAAPAPAGLRRRRWVVFG